LTSCWDEIGKMLIIHLSKIQASFGRSRIVLEHIYKGKFFVLCVGGLCF